LPLIETELSRRGVMKVGFIGLGRMGKPMAINLVRKGFDLIVHNRSRAVVDELAAMGADSAASPADVASRADVVLTCLPSAEAVESVYLGGDGLLAAARPGQLFADHSTVSPHTSRKLHALCAERDAAFLDAPISGGVPRAEDATLTIMVGGETEVLSRVERLFSALGSRVVHVGGPGAGSVVKLVNQLLVGVHSLVALEALVFGVKAGADPRKLLEVVESSFGNSAMFSRTVPMVLDRQFSSATDVRILTKDMGLITEMAKGLPVRLLFGALAEQLYVEGMGLGLATSDIVSLVQPLERIAGVEIR
jgi:3-hydroxyisobutyrate dehydrogenase-like beta-hydroxyacid dehydrogenase